MPVDPRLTFIYQSRKLAGDTSSALMFLDPAFQELVAEVAGDPSIHQEMMGIAQSGQVTSVAELRQAIDDARIKAVVGPVMDR
jgi:hypothetical protein